MSDKIIENRFDGLNNIPELKKRIESLETWKQEVWNWLHNDYPKEIAELKVGSARQTEEHKALDDICRFMFEKCAINLENLESVLKEHFSLHLDPPSDFVWCQHLKESIKKLSDKGDKKLWTQMWWDEKDYSEDIAELKRISEYYTDEQGHEAILKELSGGEVISLKEAQENLKGYVAKCKQEDKEFNERRDTALDLEGWTKPPDSNWKKQDAYRFELIYSQEGLDSKLNEQITKFIRRLESKEFMEGDDILEEIQYWEGRLK